MKARATQIRLEMRSGEIFFTQSGLSCLADKYIPPFTEMTVVISLPIEGEGYKEISFKGAVIGCEREGKNMYRLLLYFLDIDEEASRHLAPYHATR